MMRFIRWLGQSIARAVKTATRFISTATTATVAVGGALCGITNTRGSINLYRPGIALMAFTIGLPFGVIIFGGQFSIFIWLTIVIITLFLMNLHNAWEVILSLRYGGLDYIMATQAVAAAESVTPTQEDIIHLRERIKDLNVEVRRNCLREPIFDGGVLSEAEQRRLIPAKEK